MILWRTGSVDRRNADQNADQSVACPSRNKAGGFPGGPLVKSSPSNASIWDPTCLLAKKPEHKSRNNIITNSIKTKTWFIYVKILKKN